MLKAGDKAPDVELVTAGGETVRLFDLLDSGHTVLLVFLRHLA
jgi:peroxiredoxin